MTTTYLYVCPQCAPSHPATSSAYSYLLTGSHLDNTFKHKKNGDHTTGNSKKPINGVFITGTAEIVAAQQASGFYELETQGGINAYYDFDRNIAEIQFSGLCAGGTSLAKFVLLNRPEHAHPYAATGCFSPTGICHACDRLLFDHRIETPYTALSGFSYPGAW